MAALVLCGVLLLLISFSSFEVETAQAQLGSYLDSLVSANLVSPFRDLASELKLKPIKLRNGCE